MPAALQVLKGVAPKLVPFFKTVAIYFVLAKPYEKPTLFLVVTKCLPVISLMFFVLLHGMSLGHQHRYSRRILVGLIFCCIGDAFLVFPDDYFEIGMIAFGFGHISYILAFGFKPLNLPLGAFLYALNATGMLNLLRGLPGILAFAVPFYSLIICTMAWRAVARAQVFEDLWTWSKLCTCAGGLLFALSDYIIGVDRFLYKIEYANEMIMTTYYAAQLGIALSVVDECSVYQQNEIVAEGARTSAFN